MGLTKFPNGISSFGVPQLGSGAIPASTGSYFFVDSATGSDTGGVTGTDPSDPFATVDYAVGKCTANKGDVIVVMPNHSENLATAGALTIDIAGITIVGIGQGQNIPTLIHTADAADINITGADVTIRNIEIQSNTADVTASIDLDALGVCLDGVIWREGSALCFVDVIVSGGDNTCDDLKIINCKTFQGDAANDGFLNATGGDIDGLVMQNCHINRTTEAANEPVLEITGKSLTNCLVTHNYICNANTSGITFIDSDQSDNSGMVAYNAIFAADADAATPFDVSGAGCVENYQISVADKSGLLLPAVDDNT